MRKIYNTEQCLDEKVVFGSKILFVVFGTSILCFNEEIWWRHGFST